MNSVKSYLISVLGVIYLALIVTSYHSCSLEKCVGVKCANGTCTNGICNCNAGYEGSDCSTPIRFKFLGYYAVSSSCFSNGESYENKIEEDSSDIMQVKFVNMGGLGLKVGAYITNDTTITIPSQFREDVNNMWWTISGEGSYSNREGVLNLNVTYILKLNNLLENCQETYLKK